MSCMTILFLKLEITRSGIRPHIKVGCQPGDCIWSLQFSSGVCVGIYGITYSLYHPQGSLFITSSRESYCMYTIHTQKRERKGGGGGGGSLFINRY